MGYWQTRHEPIVYYMVHAKYKGAIKIGTTVNTENRLARYMKAHSNGEYLFLAWERGGPELEAKRHRQFAKYAIQGEWFFYSDELFDHVENLMCLEFEPQLQEASQ